MKRALVLVAAVAATGALPAAATTSPIPSRVLRAIPKRVPPHLRYVPTRVPAGYRYASWQGSRHGLDIYFEREGGTPALGFHAYPSGPAGTCTPGGVHTYRFGAIRVFFETTHNDQQYWRCVRAGTVSLEATTFRSDGSTSAKRRAIAAMLAFARPLR